MEGATAEDAPSIIDFFSFSTGNPVGMRWMDPEK